MDVARPGRAVGRDIGRGEAVERELDAFISKRHEQRVRSQGERREEEAWQESERRHEERQRLQARYEWHLHHTAQAERLRLTLEALASTMRSRRQD